MSAGHTGMILALALNYGSREEIVDAVKKLCKKTAEGKIKAKDIDEQVIADNLYTARLPDPDLVIRTSNEMRISNFLLWQISYAEFYITPTLWPDFTAADIDEAILAFSKRSRRMGDIRPGTI
jgi:undecaprenyl diphosphate synthase